ncbi:Putative permease (fragment) [Candidatus Propionivibrio aalborgensis]|uniref:Probable membrane transporter protein n=2 Tax=Candidatus Propionivibrio aalborgensis TaxID=1860101 RepID=A0A1A8XID7_9RHOO
MMLFVCMGTAIGIGFLTGNSSRWPSLALGSVLAIYALAGLFLPRLSVPARQEAILGPVVGCITGVLTGATGVFAVPAVPYLSALGFTKDELIQALGLSFTVSTVALAAGLGAAGGFTQGLALGSAAAVVPALAGMFIGQTVRDKLEPQTFRKWFFVAMLLVGAYMAARALGAK